jgi:hypothetical protein
MHGVSALGLDIKVFLTVHVGAPLENVSARGKRRRRVAHDKTLRRYDEVAADSSLARIRDHFQRFKYASQLGRCEACLHFALGYNDRDRLALKMYLTVCQKRFVGNYAADLIFSDKIASNDDFDNSV